METMTAPTVNEHALDQKLAALEKARPWSPRTVSRLENLIRTGDDAALFRMNPLAYAAEKGIDEDEAIELFLHGTVAGLFEMNWNLVCPGCTSVVESFASLRNLDSLFHCEICNASCEANLDDFIQISFTVSRGVRDPAFHHPATLLEREFILQYHFSREGRMNGGTHWAEAVLPHMPWYGYVMPGAEEAFLAELAEGYLVVCDLLNHNGTVLTVKRGAKGDKAAVPVTFSGSTVTAGASALPPGKTSFRALNRGEKRGLLTLINLPADYKTRFSTTFAPFLTGKRLLTTQAFRDLFRHEVICGAESLGVKDITILFTDLKGSTALYDRIGDLKAFALVREHFDILTKVINLHSGAVIKTIGDAVMGSFLNPRDALEAAIEMRDAIRLMNEGRHTHDLIIKIGVHRGASIIVTLNDRLDYFGQTVNIAARVKDLAQADEICLTDEARNHPGVGELLVGEPVAVEKARLRGVMEEMNVHRLAAA